MSPLDLVLERLESHGCTVRHQSGGWHARCPAHDDENPSLSINEGSDGNVLLNCFAGCATEQIVDVLSLKMSDLFPPRPAREAPVATYEYTDEQGIVLYKKVRKPNKAFYFQPSLSGQRRVLYRLHEVRQAIDAGRWIVIVEGEKDADRLARDGIAATTLSAGAESPWLPEYAEQLQGATKIAIIPDNDEPGRRYGTKIASALALQVDTLRWLGLDVEEKADVSDWLDSGHTTDELKTLIAAAPEWAAAPVDIDEGGRLFEDLARQIRRYVVTGPEQIDTLVLWIVHTHAIDAFYTTGRLYISSPEAECGKSRLLDVLELLVPNAINTTGISPAAMYRLLAVRTPVLLLDEVDKTIGRKGAVDSETTSLLLAILNSGYRRGKKILRCVGKNQEPTEFPTFAPVVLAGITSSFDQPFMSRSIPIDLEKRLDEELEELELDYDVEAEFAALRERVANWAGVRVERFRQSKPVRPPGLEGRKAECWLPLLKVAEAAGWSDRAHRACEALTLHEPPAAGTAAFELLRDLQGCIDEEETFAPTATLIERLHALEESDWSSYNRGRGLNAKTVGRLLGRYGIEATRQQHDGEQHRGYVIEGKLRSAWLRYVEPRTKPTQKVLNPSFFDLPATPATLPLATNGLPVHPERLPHTDPELPDSYVATEDVYPAIDDLDEATMPEDPASNGLFDGNDPRRFTR